MIRPRKMKQIQLTVLTRDVDTVIEFLGRRGIMHLSEEPGADQDSHVHVLDEAARKHIGENLEKIRSGAAYLQVELPLEPEESSRLPGETEDMLTDKITDSIALLSRRENEEAAEKRKVEEALNEARAFSNLNAPFADLDQLSYLTLRVGRLDPKKQAEIQETLADRAVLVPLGDGDRVLAAASRKGRFALDSELKKQAFVPITIPEGYKGVPAELLSGLETRLKGAESALEKTKEDKDLLRNECGPALRSLTASYLMADMVERLKGRLAATRSVYVLSGWVPADQVASLVAELEKLTENRVAVRAFNPEEVAGIREGKAKVPVSLEHGSFVKGFERVVFSYGAPLYGTIDPTPFVAFFFTVLFGIMFGDLGQGLVLLLLGILAGRRKIKLLANFRHFSSPLIAVGISSMIMGFLNGEVFTNETLLTGPTMAITGLLTGKPVERILHLMPEKDNLEKLFYFFGFTVGVGVILNSIGLLVNIINQCTLKKYEKAFFSKTGLAGLLLFWYAVFIVLRIVAGGSFAWFDIPGLALPGAGIFFGPLIWRIIARKRPILEQGLLVFIMEGFVEILETASTYISNTVSFLRVGAFALSHAVLSFIVFTLSGMVRELPVGPLFALLITVFGNAVIILLEGMIVAIQVVRLQYYEFFSKFFTDTGVEFAPFRFRREKSAD
ncbi:MAG: V-type ATP synthase subunit I [Treponema sp.]|nr:V-type ATP synthase subunit I [Treponema sp.]